MTINMSINRHHIIVVICAAVVFAAGIGAHKAWVAHVAALSAQASQKAAIAAAADREHIAQTANENSMVQQNCALETRYYSLLTPVQKKTVPAPSCQSIVIH